MTERSRLLMCQMSYVKKATVSRMSCLRCRKRRFMGSTERRFKIKVPKNADKLTRTNHFAKTGRNSKIPTEIFAYYKKKNIFTIIIHKTQTNTFLFPFSWLFWFSSVFVFVSLFATCPTS